MSNLDPKQVDQLLREGIAAAKAGKKDAARAKFRQVTEVDQNNEKAWFWLASVSESDDDKIFCLGNVTVINPQNERAKQMLEALLTKSAGAQEAQVKAPAKTKRSGGRSRVLLLLMIIVLLAVVVGVVVLPKLGCSIPGARIRPTRGKGTPKGR